MKADDLRIIASRECTGKYTKEIVHIPTGLKVKKDYPTILSDHNDLIKELELLLEANNVRITPTNYS